MNNIESSQGQHGQSESEARSIREKPDLEQQIANDLAGWTVAEDSLIRCVDCTRKRSREEGTVGSQLLEVRDIQSLVGPDGYVDVTCQDPLYTDPHGTDPHGIGGHYRIYYQSE